MGGGRGTTKVILAPIIPLQLAVAVLVTVAALPRPAAAREAMAAAAAFAEEMVSLGGGLDGRTAAALLVAAVLGLVYARGRLGSKKALDGAFSFSGSTQTPERLKVFARWAQQQIEESGPEAHRQILDDVISTFAAYAQRLDQVPSRSVRRAAEVRLQVLIELLETPTVSAALRDVNWAWLREWDQQLLDQQEARLRCTVVFPTICTAERVRRGTRPRSWDALPGRNGQPAALQSLAYLAAWCADFLQRRDARVFLGLAGPQMLAWPVRAAGSARPTSPRAALQWDASGQLGLSFMPNGALYSDSSSEEEDGSPGGRRGLAAVFGADARANGGGAGGEEHGEANSFLDFSRRTFEGQEHCWDVPDATQAVVRGERYLVDSRKVPSKSSMLELVEVDLLKSYDEMVHYAANPKGKVPKLREAGDSRFFVVLNFRLVPIQLCAIWAVPKDADWHTQPEGVLFKRFCDMSDAERNQRLKVLPKVVEGPWLVKKGVPDRPGVVGRKLAIEYFKGTDHLEVSLNCISSPAGRRLVQLLTGAARHFSMELFVILEGQQQDELPERILGGLSLYRGDLGKLATR